MAPYSRILDKLGLVYKVIYEEAKYISFHVRAYTYYEGAFTT